MVKMDRLKSLRRKFIYINMLTLTLMLLVIFSVVIGVNANHYHSVAMRSLQNLVHSTNPTNFLSTNSKITSFNDANRDKNQGLGVEQNDAGEPPEPPPDTDTTLKAEDQKVANTLPGLVVQLSSEDESLTVLFSRNMSANKSDTEDIVKTIQDTGKQQGFLLSQNLAYSIYPTPEGTKIAIVDVSYQLSSMRALVLTCLSVFVLSWLVLLLLVSRLSIWALRPVEEAWASQRQFIADASHELKTPLTVILANTHILRTHQHEAIESQMRWINSSYSEAQHMKRLIEDMLFLARSDANAQQPLATTNVSLSDVFMGVVLGFEAVALENELFLQDNIEEDITLQGNEAQLKELCTILLDNACKYAPGGTTIHITLSKHDKYAEFSVANAIREGAVLDTTRLFERFYRADSARDRQSGGYGLGLSIAQSIATSHKATIKATAKNGILTITTSFPL